MKNYGFDTMMVHAGQQSDPTTGSVVAPIYMTTAYEFESNQQAADLFALKSLGNIYTRLQNPTSDVLENRIAQLEGGVGALTFASGHAAIFNTIINLAANGDEIISSLNIYGGAINLLGNTLKSLGITTKFVNPDNLEELEAAITDKTKAIFTEVIGNPNANISDISAMAAVAHKHGIPLVVDSTFTTPYLCNPIKFGADIVIHSATKFLGGHSTSMCGIVVDSGNFKFLDNPRFPQYNTPDPSYHGLVYAKDLGNLAFILRMRVLIMRDIGACNSPFNNFMVLQGVETLSLRMKKHCENALQVATFLENHPKVKAVNYPGLESNKYYSLAKKYTPNGAGAVFTFEIDGNREIGGKVIDNLELFMNVANVGDVRSLVIHPATTTHSQLTAEQLAKSNITEGTIRLSIGIEDANDLIADLENALAKAFN